MISIEEAIKHCKNAKCGHCLTHLPPITCCNYMLNIFMNENGEDWCKKNIQEHTLSNYKKLSDYEINKVLNIKQKNKKPVYEYSLLDLIEEAI